MQGLPGKILAALGVALAIVGRFAARAGRAIGGVFAGLGRAATAFWGSLSVGARRRLVGALGVALVLLVLLGAVVPNLPCAFPGGDRCPPGDDAAEIVPADALAYAHVNLDPETEQMEKLGDLAARIPIFTEQIILRAAALAPGPEGQAADFQRDIEPWFGGEAAIAVIAGPVGSRADQVLMFEISNADLAADYAGAIAGGAAEVEDFQGVEIATDQRGLATTQVEDFLVIGSRSGVRAVVETATGAEDATALADDETAEEVRDELPDHRFAEAWVSEAGAGTLVAQPRGALASLAPFVSPESSRGAAFSLSAGDEAIELAIRSELDPERERSSPGFFAAFDEFEPQLPERLSADSLAYLGFGDPGSTVQALLGQAAAEAPGIAAGFEDLVARLRRASELDIEKELLPVLGDEAAVAIEPRPGGEVPGEAGPPYLEFVAAGVDEEEARQALAALQLPLSEAVDPGSDLQAPGFNSTEVGGVEVRTLTVSPAQQISYAVFDGLAVLASDPAGIEQLVEGEGGLDESEAFERATEGFGDEVALLAYLDLGQLLAAGYEIGLAEVPAFNTFADELRQLQAFALEVESDDDSLATDARVVLGELTSRAND